VSKSRSKSKKTAAKRAKPAKRGGAKKRAKKAAAPKPNQIELRPIRTKLKAHVSRLGAVVGATPGTNPQVEEALKRMSRWLDDIQDICGPDMMIPLP
jgi:hypothetical protein